MNILLLGLYLLSWVAVPVHCFDFASKQDTALTRLGSSFDGNLFAQASDAKTGAKEDQLLPDDSQNWGAMIVFVIGIGIFLAGYMYIREMPASGKKNKKKNKKRF